MNPLRKATPVLVTTSALIGAVSCTLGMVRGGWMGLALGLAIWWGVIAVAVTFLYCFARRPNGGLRASTAHAAVARSLSLSTSEL